MDTQYAATASGPYLLMSFIKNWKNQQGTISWKWIKCKIWFGTLEEMATFVKGHQEDPRYHPNPFDKENFESWSDYFTMKVKLDK